MADVSTPRGLLIMALQDLYDAESAMVERLGTVRSNLKDGDVRAIVEQDEQRSSDQREAVAELTRSLDAKPDDAKNIWLRAILDDADNDADTIAPGPLLDIALVGALRKGKQAERVSYETAQALATRLGMGDAAATLADIAQMEAETDASLARSLWRLNKDLQDA